MNLQCSECCTGEVSLQIQKTQLINKQCKVQILNNEESCLSFYQLGQHGEAGQELCEFLLVRRLSQVIKDLINEDVFVWKSRKSQHQQLCSLIRSQESKDLQLNGRAGTKTCLQLLKIKRYWFSRALMLAGLKPYRVKLWVEVKQLFEGQEL